MFAFDNQQRGTFLLKYTTEHIAQLISQSGLKVTQQRIVVYRALLETTKHPTAEQVYEMVRPENPSISLGTIYKTLEALAGTGLVKKVPTPGSQMRYDARREDHSHIYVTNTDEIIDFFDDELRKVIMEHIKRKHPENLRIHKFSLHIEGEKIDPEKQIIIN